MSYVLWASNVRTQTRIIIVTCFTSVISAHTPISNLRQQLRYCFNSYICLLLIAAPLGNYSFLRDLLGFAGSREKGDTKTWTSKISYTVEHWYFMLTAFYYSKNMCFLIILRSRIIVLIFWIYMTNTIQKIIS